MPAVWAREADDLQADQDPVRGQIGRFAGALKAVDDEAVGFDGEVKEIEGDPASSTLPPVASSSTLTTSLPTRR